MKTTDRNKLGQRGPEITAMGFGAVPLGGLYSPVSDEDGRATVQATWGAGIRFFDTAPLYGHGLSEHRLGEALRWQDRDTWVLSTKVGRLLRPADPAAIERGQWSQILPFEGVYDYSYDGIMRAFEDSLQRIGTNRIDVLLAHDVDIWTHGSQAAWQQRFDELMAGGYRAMLRLREEGVVKAIGAGVNEAEACQAMLEAGDFDCFLLAGRYTLLEQGALDSFLPLCVTRGVSLIIGGAYNSGILASGAIEGAMYNYAPAPPAILQRVRRIEAVCARHRVPLRSAALQFPLHHPAVATVIPGMRTPAEVEENVRILEAPIPPDFWAELRHEGLLRADAPTP